MYGYDIFHKKLMMRLIDNVRSNKNANTYIFEGHEGLQKKEAALLFAKALVCDNPNSAPCCNCPSCREAQTGIHPDIIHIEKEKELKQFGVNPIREMIAECAVTPFYNRHKVFILNEGDILNPQAQNAFLKVIEEPPSYAVFIIVCTDSQTLLETVRSRSIIITFPPVSDDIVRKYITEKYPDELRTDFLVKFCSGIPKTADKVIERKDFEQLREETLNLTPKLLSKNKLYAYDVAQYFEKHKDNAKECFDMILMYLRDALVTAEGSGDKIINTDKKDKINILSQRYSQALISSGIDELITAEKMINRYIKVSAVALHAALKTGQNSLL